MQWGEVEIEKLRFHCSKSSIDVDDVNTNKVTMVTRPLVEKRVLKVPKRNYTIMDLSPKNGM